MAARWTLFSCCSGAGVPPAYRVDGTDATHGGVLARKAPVLTREEFIAGAAQHATLLPFPPGRRIAGPVTEGFKEYQRVCHARPISAEPTLAFGDSEVICTAALRAVIEERFPNMALNIQANRATQSMPDVTIGLHPAIDGKLDGFAYWSMFEWMLLHVRAAMLTTEMVEAGFVGLEIMRFNLTRCLSHDARYTDHPVLSLIEIVASPYNPTSDEHMPSQKLDVAMTSDPRSVVFRMSINGRQVKEVFDHEMDRLAGLKSPDHVTVGSATRPGQRPSAERERLPDPDDKRFMRDHRHDVCTLEIRGDAWRSWSVHPAAPQAASAAASSAAASSSAAAPQEAAAAAAALAPTPP